MGSFPLVVISKFPSKSLATALVVLFSKTDTPGIGILL